MHGLICKSLEEFVRDRHGDVAWLRIVQAAGLPQISFEALRTYDDDQIDRAFLAASEGLGRTIPALQEDIGHWICTHPPLEPVRRLIRFSGRDFVDLIFSLDEMQERARIALPGLDLPCFRVGECGPQSFEISSTWHLQGGGAVLMGILRAMADDYGTLAIIDVADRRKIGSEWHEVLTVQIFDQAYQEPREFTLGTAP